MRAKQLNILHNLHNEMRKIRRMPAQVKIVAEYMLYLTDYVVELNSPEKQIRRLEQIFEEMKREPLPVTRDEFESRAVLYHILMDLEEFLTVKKRCMVLEDSENGLRAAKAAGCIAVVVPDLSPAPPKEEGLWDWNVEPLSEVISVIAELRGK